MHAIEADDNLAGALQPGEPHPRSVRGDPTERLPEHLPNKKRKVEVDSVYATNHDDDANGHNEHDINSRGIQLANTISDAMDGPVADETIHLCGPAPLAIISDHPDEVLNLAYDKLNAWPFQQVDTCWRRLYEEASLCKAIDLLRAQADSAKPGCNGSRRRKKLGDVIVDSDWITGLVMILDKGLTLSGAPGRRAIFEATLQELEDFCDDSTDAGLPECFDMRRLDPLRSEHAIPRAREVLDFAAFQNHLDEASTPLMIPDMLCEWPASQRWHFPAYLMRLTLGGRRIVPVEIGKSYIEAGWTQRVMTFGQFLKSYLLPQEPKGIGYLAQHDLFAQIPALRNDVMIPDYCYTSPPEPDAAVSNTMGLVGVKQLEAPLLNAWFGPKGTKTPLHTDPYHNILCQVVGSKYIRLYPPTETPKLYPLGQDDKGIDLSNTSQVDVSRTRFGYSNGSTDSDAVRDMEREFPLFAEARYQEAILGPGECLYVPLGWWHYVEGLSTSFSVSFWWN